MNHNQNCAIAVKPQHLRAGSMLWKQCMLATKRAGQFPFLAECLHELGAPFLFSKQLKNGSGSIISVFWQLTKGMAERRTNPLFRLACDPRDQVYTMEFTLPEIERCRALYGNITAVHVSSIVVTLDCRTCTGNGWICAKIEVFDLCDRNRRWLKLAPEVRPYYKF